MDVVVEVGVLEVLVLEEVDVPVDRKVFPDGLRIRAGEGVFQGVDVLGLNEEELFLLLEVLVLDAVEVLVNFLDFLLGLEEILDDVEEPALFLGQYFPVFVE